ncbi:MAG: 2-amino-4-hydroxy-6-hydroxymethyldihydropteridine diphosphokinase [Actinobacteria bacterium]|nr:MAG: 2-amino-4-hydroxy-6-hydroxymethyldihydropteridine diphosphokinase [Actinomycetota bacterium]
MAEALVGLGSNLGDRVANLAEALARIDEVDGLAVLRVSRAVESEPWGVTDQPAFANAVAVVRSDLQADALLEWLRGIEDEMGRDRATDPNGPRVIDLDLLLFGDEEWAPRDPAFGLPDPGRLTLPHPRMLEREFVMRPLLEVAPDAALPDGRPLAGLLGGATEGRIIGDLGTVRSDLTPIAVGPGPDGATRLARMPGESELDYAERVAMLAPDVCEERFDTLVAEHWVPVAVAWGGQRLDRTPMMDLHYAFAEIRAQGIPVTWHPHEPTEGTNPWGVGETVSIAVPAAFADAARAIVMDLAAEWVAPDGAELPSPSQGRDGSFIVPQVGGTLAFVEAIRRARLQKALLWVLVLTLAVNLLGWLVSAIADWLGLF